MDVLLENSSVSALGIGSSVTSAGITSQRMVAITADIAASDIKINGEDFSSAAVDVNSTSSFDADGN